VGPTAIYRPYCQTSTHHSAMMPTPFLTTRRSEGLRQLRIFSSSLARRTVTLFYFPVGKFAPTELFARSPLCTRRIGLRDFARSAVEHCTLRVPKTRRQLALTFPSISELFLLRFRHLRYQTTRFATPDCRCAETPTHVRTDYSTFHLIGNSGFAILRILIHRCRTSHCETPIRRATYLPL
jgi:hypothetical protein